MTARLPLPPLIVTYDHREEVTPVVRVCLDCAGESMVLDNDIQPPAKPSEAWAMLSCRGTADLTLWRWCFRLGEMAMPSQGLRVKFDRRKGKR